MSPIERGDGISCPPSPPENCPFCESPRYKDSPEPFVVIYTCGAWQEKPLAGVARQTQRPVRCYTRQVERLQAEIDRLRRDASLIPHP